MALLNAALAQPQRLTTAERDAMSLGITDRGRMIFNTTLGTLQTWSGSAWVSPLLENSPISGSQLTAPINASLITLGTLDGGQF